ncbi:MAG: PepSY domain-containing protein [Veillonellales bacterium]
MYITVQKIHQWIGLVLALFLLAEAISGLILAEPWLAGQSKGTPHQGVERSQVGDEKSTLQDRSRQPATLNISEKPAQTTFNIFGFAKGLHQGRIGNINLSWLIDLLAIGIIILTLTGIYLTWLRIRISRK